MGIESETNPGLALRNISEYKDGNRKYIEECIPAILKERSEYSFLKKGQRNFYLKDEIPLYETKGDGDISRPIASVTILEATHFVKLGEVYTKGSYRVNEVFIDDKVYFEGFERINKRK